MTKDRVNLDRGDFRQSRRYLAPHLFVLGGDDPDPPPTDLIPKETWIGVVDLPTDVALRTSSYDGSVITRLADLHSDWIFSWPGLGEAPYMEEPALLAGEEFDALIFNALHGYYRQAIGCLRNALEVLAVAAGLAVSNNQALYAAWRSGQEIRYGQALTWLRDSPAGKRINATAPNVVFDKDPASWARLRYADCAGTPTAGRDMTPRTSGRATAPSTCPRRCRSWSKSSARPSHWHTFWSGWGGLPSRRDGASRDCSPASIAVGASTFSS